MSEYDFLNNSLMTKIAKLATSRQLPFIIIQDPKNQIKDLPMDVVRFTYIASIGEVHVGFDGFAPADLIDLYSELKTGLEVDDMKRRVVASSYESGYAAAKEDHAKSP